MMAPMFSDFVPHGSNVPVLVPHAPVSDFGPKVPMSLIL